MFVLRPFTRPRRTCWFSPAIDPYEKRSVKTSRDFEYSKYRAADELKSSNSPSPGCHDFRRKHRGSLAETTDGRGRFTSGANEIQAAETAVPYSGWSCFDGGIYTVYSSRSSRKLKTKFFFLNLSLCVKNKRFVY